MNAITLGVYVDEMEDVTREIVVRDDYKFVDLHELLTRTFQIDIDSSGSFFISNRRWQKLNEITLDYSSGFENALDGNETAVGAVAGKETTNFIYFNEDHTDLNFLIQVENIEAIDPARTYPVLKKAEGAITRDFRTASDMFGDTSGYDDEMLGDGFGTEGEDV